MEKKFVLRTSLGFITKEQDGPYNMTNNLKEALHFTDESYAKKKRDLGYYLFNMLNRPKRGGFLLCSLLYWNSCAILKPKIERVCLPPMVQFNAASLQTSIAAFRQTVRDTYEHSSEDFPFQEFLIDNHPGTLAVIDGSNYNIRGRNFVLSCLRAGHLLFQRGVEVFASSDPIVMEFITNNDSYPMGYKHKYQQYFSRITTGDYTGRIEFEKITDRLRSIMEWERVKELIETLEKHDIILFDGSLLSGEITLNDTFYNTIVSRAKEKGIILIGLSKDTSMSIGSAPAPLVLLQASQRTHANKNWMVRHEDTWFVKFTQDENTVFRLDVEVPEGVMEEQALQWVGSYALFKFMLGFAYPAQFIHEHVKISEGMKQICFEEFQNLCLEQGMSQHELNTMFAIYHDTMDVHARGQ